MELKNPLDDRSYRSDPIGISLASTLGHPHRYAAKLPYVPYGTLVEH